MVAETLTSTRAARTFPMIAVGGGVLCCAYGMYTIAAAVEDGDIFEMCRIPKGATLVGGYFGGADLDTGTEVLDMDIGWAANGVDAADPDGLGNLGVLSGDAITDFRPTVGLFYPFQGLFLTGGPITFGADTILQIEANTPANAGHVGVITMVAYYVMP